MRPTSGERAVAFAAGALLAMVYLIGSVAKIGGSQR